ncbi:MAG: hypothetical protein ACYTG0_17765 [Planctomycetota bacterium]|jgi:hypothetical protein
MLVDDGSKQRQNDMVAAQNTATQPKSRRRWFQFSLRTLLIVVTVFAVWLAYRANRVAQQRRALAMVKRLCANRRLTNYDPIAFGGVAYDYQLQTSGNRTTYDPLTQPPAPTWLGQFIGEERPVTIDLSDTDVTDADLVALEGLSSLQTLRLYRTAVTKKAVNRLQRALPDCRVQWSPLDM